MKIFGKFRYVRPVKVGGERDVVPLEPSSVPPRSHADGVSHKVKGISWAVVTCCTRAVEAYFCSVVAAAYMDVMQYKDFTGIKWRELKAGASTTCSFTRKWSEKGFISKAGNSDSSQINTGTFFQTNLDTGSVHPSGALSPSSVDLVNFKIRPFDKQSLEKMAHNDPRVMVTIDVDYIVKCFEPKQDYTNPYPSH